MQKLLAVLLFASSSSFSNAQTHAAFDSTRYEVFLEVTLTNGEIIKLSDRDTVINRPDSAIAVCLKVVDLLTNSIYQPFENLAVFMIYPHRPKPVLLEDCFTNLAINNYNSLMNTAGDQVRFYGAKFKNSTGEIVATPTIILGGNRKE